MTLLKKPLLKKAPSKKAPTQKRPRSNEASSTPRKRIKSESIEESTDVEDELDEADAGEDEDSNESENYALDDAERSDEETGDDEPADAPDTEFEDISADWEPPKNALAKTRSSDKALSTSDPLQAYMRDVQRHPLLTAEEEKSLALRYHQDGDVKAAARLVTSNLRLVVKLAYEYRRAYRNMMDLIQEGNIGLMQAVKRYDPHRGVKLSSYAAWWIRAYMLRYILNNWRLVKLGTTQAQRKLFFNLNKEKARLASMGIEPTPELIAERLDVESKEVIEMDRRLASADSSLDVPVGDGDGRTTTRLDLLPSIAATPDVNAEQAELSQIILEHLGEFRETLSEKDQTIFDLRMVAEDPLTLQELGERFGVSRERVRQLEARISGKLRLFLEEHLGDVARPSFGS